jgi:hypothetical protein
VPQHKPHLLNAYYAGEIIHDGILYLPALCRLRRAGHSPSLADDPRLKMGYAPDVRLPHRGSAAGRAR